MKIQAVYFLGVCRYPGTYIPSQSVPFPVNPCLQVQLKDPSLLVQSAFLSHGLESAEHSSISAVVRQNEQNFSINLWNAGLKSYPSIRTHFSFLIALFGINDFYGTLYLFTNTPAQFAPSPVNPCLQLQPYEPIVLMQSA